MKTKLFQLVACLLVAFSGYAAEPFLNDLLPRPQKIEMHEGDLILFPKTWHVTVTAPNREGLERLQARMTESLNELGISAKMKMMEAEQYSVSLRSSSRKSTFAFSPSAEIPAELKKQAYSLEVNRKGILVSASAEEGLFYGMMTLKQLINSAKVRGEKKLPGLRIDDWPALKMRGFSEDYGRDQLPTMEEHKRLIRLLAQFKINTYLWFIEPDHFVYQFDPEISTEYDRFRFEEIRELVAYAKQYYIEVIPTVELLGHMEMTLRNEKYAKLGEMPNGGGDLCPTSDESFELIRKMVTEIAPAFGGHYFHCGLDESFAVGKGRSAEAVKNKGIERVFADYYTRMDDLVKSQHQTMMMYADIVLNHPDMLPMLPKDIVMMFWDYSPRDEYPGLTKLKENHLPTTALSGLWSWNNLYPIYVPAFKNMESLAKQAVRDGALGHFVSGWGDGFKGASGFNLSELDLYGVVYCGAVSWKPEPIPMEAYSAAFATQCFGSADTRLAGALTRLAQCQGADTTRSTQARFMFNSDALETVYAMSTAKEEDLRYWQQLQKETKDVCAILEVTPVPVNGDYLRTINLAAKMLGCSADMALDCRALALDMEKPDLNRTSYTMKMGQLASQHETLKQQYRAVWEATNRPLNLNRIEKMWTPTIASFRELAAALASGTFPASTPKGLKVAFTFDGKGELAWQGTPDTGLVLAPVKNLPAPVLKTGGPSSKGTCLSLNQGARCEGNDAKRLLDFQTGPFLIEAWVRHSGQEEKQYGSSIFSYGLDGGWRFGLNHKGEVLFTLYGIGEQTGLHSVIPPDGKWHHVAVNFHHCSNVDYYVDGKLTDQLVLKGYPKSPANPLIRVGNEIGLVTPFAGDIDRIRVSAGIYTPDEMDSRP